MGFLKWGNLFFFLPRAICAGITSFTGSYRIINYLLQAYWILSPTCGWTCRDWTKWLGLQMRLSPPMIEHTQDASWSDYHLCLYTASSWHSFLFPNLLLGSLSWSQLLLSNSPLLKFKNQLPTRTWMVLWGNHLEALESPKCSFLHEFWKGIPA